MQVLVWTLLSVIVTGISAQGQTCLQTDVNEYLDQVLERARQELPDPMRLPPRSSIVDLTEGQAWGMSNLTRRGEAEVECGADNTVVITATLTTDELKGRYKWSRKSGSPKNEREGLVVFISDDFEAKAQLTIHRQSGQKTHPELTKFTISKFKDARIEMTGMGFVTWTLAEAVTLFSGIFQRAIAGAVQEPLRDALERQMREISIE